MAVLAHVRDLGSDAESCTSELELRLDTCHPHLLWPCCTVPCKTDSTKSLKLCMNASNGYARACTTKLSAEFLSPGSLLLLHVAAVNHFNSPDIWPRGSLAVQAQEVALLHPLACSLRMPLLAAA